MRSRFDTEVDKQLDLAWAKMDLQAKLFITNAQYNDTVFEAFIAGARIALSLPLGELVSESVNQKLNELLAQVREGQSQ